MFSSTIALGLLALSSVSYALGPAAVNLGSAANYVILSKRGITNVANSRITGDLGTSPIGSTAVTGFSLTLDSTGTFSTSSQVTGKVYAASYASPTPSNLTIAIGALGTAYNDASGRPSPNFLNLNGGLLAGLTLTPGLYKWTTAVTATSSFTLSGSSTDTWIFQVARTFAISTNQQIVLSGGALAKNVVFAIADQITIGTGATVSGVFLGATGVSLGAGATVHGRLLVGTAATLIQNTITAA